MGSRTNSYPSGPGSQSGASLDSPIPPLPPQHCSSGFALGTRLPPPPPLPPSCRPQRVWPESFASPAGGSDVSPRLGRPGEEQVRQGNQEVSVSERAGDLSGGQQDAGPSQSGGCTSSGPSEGAVDASLELFYRCAAVSGACILIFLMVNIGAVVVHLQKLTVMMTAVFMLLEFDHFADAVSRRK